MTPPAKCTRLFSRSISAIAPVAVKLVPLMLTSPLIWTFLLSPVTSSVAEMIISSSLTSGWLLSSASAVVPVFSFSPSSRVDSVDSEFNSLASGVATFVRFSSAIPNRLKLNIRPTTSSHLILLIISLLDAFHIPE